MAKAEVLLWLHTTLGSSTVCDKYRQNDWSQLFMASNESLKGLFKQQTFKQHRVLQLGKVLCLWFTAVHSEAKPVTGPVIIEKANSLIMK